MRQRAECKANRPTESKQNIELNLQSLFGLHVYSCTHWLRPHNTPPIPPHLGSYTRALLVSQDRRHLCITPWSRGKIEGIRFNQLTQQRWEPRGRQSDWSVGSRSQSAPPAPAGPPPPSAGPSVAPPAHRTVVSSSCSCWSSSPLSRSLCSSTCTQDSS